MVVGVSPRDGDAAPVCGAGSSSVDRCRPTRSTGGIAVRRAVASIQGRLAWRLGLLFVVVFLGALVLTFARYRAGDLEVPTRLVQKHVREIIAALKVEPDGRLTIRHLYRACRSSVTLVPAPLRRTASPVVTRRLAPAAATGTYDGITMLVS